MATTYSWQCCRRYGYNSNFLSDSSKATNYATVSAKVILFFLFL